MDVAHQLVALSGLWFLGGLVYTHVWAKPPTEPQAVRIQPNVLFVLPFIFSCVFLLVSAASTPKQEMQQTDTQVREEAPLQALDELSLSSEVRTEIPATQEDEPHAGALDVRMYEGDGVKRNATSATPSSAEAYLVTRVVDGDTIEVLMRGEKKTVRYIGVNTPETVHPTKGVECFGREASAHNKELVLGKSVRLEKDVSETDRYGRLLRYVYLGDTLINLALVQDGYAYASTFPPDVAMAEVFRRAQDEARAGKRGLWGVACGTETNTVPAPEAALREGSEQTSGSCSIKGNISSSGEKIYHTPNCDSYEKTVINEDAGEMWFCTEESARAQGWRKALNCS